MTSVVLVMLAALMMWAFYHPSDSTDVEQGGALGWCLATLLIAAAMQVFCVGRSFLVAQGERDSRDRADRTGQWLIDGIVCLLAGWIGYAAVAQLNVPTRSLDGAGTIGGDWRAASNEAWVWIAGAVWFVGLRRWLRGQQTRSSSGELRSNQFALLGLVVVGAVLLATHALHQVHVSLPQTWREYNADPERVLAEVGISAPEGSNARMIFENRLRDGGPTATFALANTLAGLLAMALVVVIAVLLPVLGSTFPKAISRLRVGNDRSTVKPEATSRPSAAVSIGLVLVAASLALALKDTQSRAGMLSVLIVGGCALLDFVWSTSRGRRCVTALSLAISAVFVAMPLAARGWFGTGWMAGLPESVRYRFQYWEATWRMVDYSPWTGAGPGNYQQAYHRFRLPESHEVIADPHHFVCETLGAGGFPAGLLLVGLLVVGAWLFWRAERGTNELKSPDLAAEPKLPEPVWASGSGGSFVRWSVPVGAAVGLLAVWGLGIRNRDLPDFDAHLIAIPVACAAGWLWWFRLADESSATDPGWDVRRIAGFALMAGCMHLSFSGGWTVPGIAVVLWTLAAMVTCSGRCWSLSGPFRISGAEDSLAKDSRTRVPDGPMEFRGRLRAVASAVVVGLAALTMWMVSYRPVTESRRWMAEADTQIRRGNLVGGEKLCQRAMEADQHAFDPAIFRLHVIEQAWLQRFAANPSSVGISPRFQEALENAIQRAGNDPSRLQAIGELVLHRYQVGGETEALAQAKMIYDRCQRLSPWHQVIAAQRALIAEAEGAPAETVRELAGKAVELAEAGGVVTRQLALQWILVVRPIGRSAIQQPVRQSAQVAMDALRL
ncbi:O-antigen ligase family protein [Rhodopirellula sp. P2]|uniref:O-antigen ligase family protein n=1 Tax=Rhodopirellula sp. P2 TaxID=2127060 RepID=UPI002367AED8|nr:O-antigen ligase family protein [Rhodopirellula sp. P2]WDQ18813.1 O-antigen ligase family protein [Rhodopirellula sp. P2]